MSEWRKEAVKAKNEMQELHHRMQDVYTLAKQWLRMTPYVYMAIDPTTFEIKYVFGRWDKLGYAPEDMLEKHLADFIHPDDYERTLDEVSRREHGLTDVAFVNRYRCKCGDHWASIKWFNDGGTLAGELAVGAGNVEGGCARDGE